MSFFRLAIAAFCTAFAAVAAPADLADLARQYLVDLVRLDTMVDDLKSRGMTKANRSALIRAALDQVDLAKVPRGI